MIYRCCYAPLILINLTMETFIWNTEYAHNDNEQTMQEWLHEYCELDITLTDGTYAEGMDKQGNLWGNSCKR